MCGQYCLQEINSDYEAKRYKDITPWSGKIIKSVSFHRSLLLIALAKLSQEDFRALCIDLRGNTGGYLQSALSVDLA